MLQLNEKMRLYKMFEELDHKVDVLKTTLKSIKPNINKDSVRQEFMLQFENITRDIVLQSHQGLKYFSEKLNIHTKHHMNEIKNKFNECMANFTNSTDLSATDFYNLSVMQIALFNNTLSKVSVQIEREINFFNQQNTKTNKSL